MTLSRLFMLIAAAAVLPTALYAGTSGTGNVVLHGPDGAQTGMVEVQEMNGGLSLHGMVKDVEPGVHAIHIHETGRCEGDFSSAGGHFNPTDAKHGMLSDAGHHLGDMPNIVVPASGEVTFSVFAPGLSLAEQGNMNEHASDRYSVFDEDGSAIVIHAGADDYKTNPAGAAGNRVACGVFPDNG